MSKYDVVVIGGGPAGITLSKIVGKRLKVAVIRPEEHSMVYCAMPYAIEGLLEVEKTFKADSLVTDAGAELIRGLVTDVDVEKRQLRLNGGATISYDKLVIATGARPLIPQVPGRDLEGVTGFKTENDLKKVMDLLKTGTSKAVVVGAGAIGLELSLALIFQGIEVHLVDMEDFVLPNLLDPDMADELKEEIAGTGIDLHLRSKVVGLKGESRVEQVILDTGEIIRLGAADGRKGSKQGTLPGIVIFAAGMVPEISLFTDCGLVIGKEGIVVNDRMETNLPGVYAAGDCVQFVSGITKKVISGKLATNAVPMAKVLAFNLLGIPRTYPGFFNGVATKVGKFFVGGTGLTEKSAMECGYDTVCGYGKLTTQFPIMPDAKPVYMKLIADKKTHQLLGAQVVSGEPVSVRVDLFTFAIQKKTTIEELADLSYSAQPFQSFFPAANIIVTAAEDLLKKLQMEAGMKKSTAV